MASSEVKPQEQIFVDLSAVYNTVNHKPLLNKIVKITDDAKFTNLIGNIFSNRRFFVELKW